MLYSKKQVTGLSSLATLLSIVILSWAAPSASAWQRPQQANAKPANATATATEERLPPFHEYKGVRIGMSMEEARKLLGSPTDKSDSQDFYAFSEKETAQVYYEDKKVSALAVVYVGNDSGAPSCNTVFGSDTPTKPDGSVHRMERYPKVGFWLSCSRTAGDSPLTTVTLRKL